jgi:DNA-binding transcriptional LysR family regulator
MSKDVTLRQLKYFAAAAETGQFSMAASSAHVTQSAVTNAVLQLEDTLGVKLFERLPHGVALTAEGHRFYQHARHVLDSLKDALSEPRFQSHTLQGVVSIGASYTVLGYFLPELLARFRMRYPDVELDLRDMTRPAIEEAVLAGELELGIALMSNSPAPERFGRQTLMRSRRQLWLSGNHPLLDNPFPTLADIAPYPFILLTEDEGDLATERYWQARSLAPSIAFRTSSMEAVRGLVAHGFGVTILSDMVYRPWSLEGKKLEARPIHDAVPHMEVGMIWHPAAEFGECAEAFRQFLIHACGS